MLLLTAILPILLLLALAWQDFRYREVYAFSFLLVWAALLLGAYLGSTLSWRHVSFNMLLLLLHAVLLYAYCSLRGLRCQLMGQQLIGLGDLAFFVILTCCFSPTNYMLFLAGSLIITLVAALTYRLMGGRQGTVPLAGAQAVLLAIVLACELYLGANIRYTDENLLSLIE